MNKINKKELINIYESRKGKQIPSEQEELFGRAIEIIKQQDVQLNSLKTVFGLKTTKELNK